jgi:hypothetical protein
VKGATWEPGLTAVCVVCGVIGDGTFPQGWGITSNEDGQGIIICPVCLGAVAEPPQEKNVT